MLSYLMLQECKTHQSSPGRCDTTASLCIFIYYWIIMVVSLTTLQWLVYTVLLCFLMPQLVPFQEKKLVAEIKKTAKTGNEVSVLGFCGRYLFPNNFLLDVLQYMFCIALGGNQNFSSAISQAQATNRKFTRYTGTDSWSSYPHTGISSFQFDLCNCKF